MTSDTTRRQRWLPYFIGVASLTLILGFAPRPSVAQIYELDDAHGRHYTTSLDQIPPDQRKRAKVFIPASELPSPITSDDGGVEPETAAAAPPAADVEPKDYSRDDELEALRNTWLDGFHAGRGEITSQAPAPPPTIIIQSPPTVIVTVPRNDPAGLYYHPNEQTQMSVPFDGGRTRGLTHRQHLQELHRLRQSRW